VLCENVIVNRGALVGHDVRLNSFCTVGPGANIAGGVTVNECGYIGVGAVVRDHLSIGADAVVGAGAVVVKPVPPGVLVMGVPARIVETNMKGL
jgi:serine acetyltransferase